ncbi:MAG: hypothetical protein K0V04_33910 [Deltaproteobacteria bacterium]|nr:hypothetical protein [Deltaproteobacteria bacterium]
MISISCLRLSFLLGIPAVMSACTEGSTASDFDRHSARLRCDVVQLVTEYADRSHDEFFTCIDDPVRLELDPEFEREHWDLLVSGRATIDIDRSPAMIAGGAPLESSEITIDESSYFRSDPDPAMLGEASVLVVRIETPDATHPLSEAELSADVFGGPDDLINLKSQIDQCSHGKRTIEPAEVPGPHRGVMTVAVDLMAADHDSRELANAAAGLAKTQLGLDEGVESTFDHVMYCVPPGSKTPFLAWAYSNHSRTVYNDHWCSVPVVQAHEVGHNMGLGHTGRDDEKYADTTGNMGYASNHEEGANKCFNAARSSLLGWYADKEVTIEAGTSGEYELVGAVDYPRASERQQVLLKIVAPDGNRVLHVAYNVGKGPNEGTDDTREHVTVVEQLLPVGQPSSRLAALTEDSEPFVDSAQSVTIEVLERTREQEIDAALVRVTYADEMSD